jgi:hypothetical protein
MQILRSYRAGYLSWDELVLILRNYSWKRMKARRPTLTEIAEGATWSDDDFPKEGTWEEIQAAEDIVYEQGAEGEEPNYLLSEEEITRLGDALDEGYEDEEIEVRHTITGPQKKRALLALKEGRAARFTRKRDIVVVRPMDGMYNLAAFVGNGPYSRVFTDPSGALSGASTLLSQGNPIDYFTA